MSVRRPGLAVPCRRSGATVVEGMIESLAEGEVFVFGSNAEGRHRAGAAYTAYERFGAVWGQGEGLQGQSYAIPTMGDWMEVVAAVGRFRNFAAEHPEMRFLVTAVGTGIAGWSSVEMARLFVGAPVNVVLPEVFVAVLREEL